MSGSIAPVACPAFKRLADLCESKGFKLKLTAVGDPKGPVGDEWRDTVLQVQGVHGATLSRVPVNRNLGFDDAARIALRRVR